MADHVVKAFGIIGTQGHGSGGMTLFVEGGRGSTQFVVVDSSGTVLLKAHADGFPKEGEVSYDQKRAAAQQVRRRRRRRPSLPPTATHPTHPTSPPPPPPPHFRAYNHPCGRAGVLAVPVPVGGRCCVYNVTFELGLEC